MMLRRLLKALQLRERRLEQRPNLPVASIPDVPRRRRLSALAFEHARFARSAMGARRPRTWPAARLQHTYGLWRDLGTGSATAWKLPKG
jgi:hypothetical protein